MRLVSDWSSDVCSSDLLRSRRRGAHPAPAQGEHCAFTKRDQNFMCRKRLTLRQKSKTVDRHSTKFVSARRRNQHASRVRSPKSEHPISTWLLPLISFGTLQIVPK